MKYWISTFTVLALFLLSGCSLEMSATPLASTQAIESSSAPTDAPDPATLLPTTLPTPNNSSPQDNSYAIFWQRQGGKERACLRLEIYYDGSYNLDDCSMQGQLSRGMLSAEQFAPLKDKLERYSAFTWSLPPQKELIDLVKDSYTFNGKGIENMAQDQQGALNSYLAKLATQLSLTALPPQAPGANNIAA